jgi:anti-sigma factor RsiW
MKHPSEATLALYAGQDLGAMARWQTRRHLAGCPQCRSEVTSFSALRQEVTDLRELPEISWNSLAAEMKANIRVGLAAGECIRDTRHPLKSGFWEMRTALACASVAALLLAGLWLERPAPAPVAIAEQTPGVFLQAVEHGIEVRDGDQAFVLRNGSAGEVTYSAGAQGSIGARFVDRSTGYMTINTVYVQ